MPVARVMIKVRVAGMLAGAVLLCVGTMAMVEVALAQEPTNSQEVARVLETARLSPDGKLLIRQKAGEAIRAGVAEGDVANVIRLGVDHGTQAADLGSLLDVVTRAKRHDIPVGPVLDKVQEGLAKRVTPDRIASVASHVSENLLAARQVVRRAEQGGVRVERGSERNKTVEAVAEALGRGVTT